MFSRFPLLGTILSVVVLITASCKEEDPKIVQCYLRTIGVQLGSASPSDIVNYEYMNDKIVSMTSSSVVTFFTYDSKNNLTEASNGSRSTKYYYNLKNQVTKSETIDAQGTLLSKSEYTDYNSKGLLTGMTYYEKNQAGNLTVSTSYTYEYSDDREINLISTKQYAPDGFLLFSIAYEYDNKKGFLSALPYGLRILIQTAHMAEISDNNYTKVTSTDFTNDIGTLSYTFEYNENGYPVKRTLGSGGNVRYFTYDCK